MKNMNICKKRGVFFENKKNLVVHKEKVSLTDYAKNHARY
jgi:hypothetical protein